MTGFKPVPQPTEDATGSRTNMMNIATTLIAPLLILQFQSAPPAPPSFTATLLAAHESVQPGGQTELLVEIDIGRPWHIYHPIVLDTGLATDVQFDVPPGVTIGELRYPAPHLGESVGLEYLELSGKVRCIAPVMIATDVEAGTTITIRADVSGLACVEMCLPVSTSATLELPITEQPGKPANEKKFEEARKALAPLLAESPHLAGSELRVSKDKLGIDEPAELIATIRVEKGYNVWDRDPGVAGLSASRLFVEKVSGLEFADDEQQMWPELHVLDLAGIGKVRAHAGEFEIRVPFRIADPELPAGPVALRVLFSYEGCDDAGTRFPPVMAAATARFEALTPNATAAETLADGSDQRVAHEGTPTENNRAGSPVPTAEEWEGHIPWRPWRPGLAEELARQGHLVYVDYTATWCLTCQANKKLVLETDAVRGKMRDLGVIPLEADFTNRDPVMHGELKRWAPTVPVNVVYVPGKPEIVALLPAVLTRDEVISALEDPEAYAARGEENQSLILVLFFGFLGGLILNIMPCVLPVISIKILSFVQQAGEDPKRVFRLGLAFCGGIMVWFWAFAYLCTRGDLPWQYPEVVVALGAILFVFALSLFGVFEIVLPGAAAGQLGAIANREGYGGAFLKGLLATLLGTACTAPFLAGAMAYALTQPTGVVFLVFTAAGLGMAAPYLLLSAQPAWLKFIPKPGAWMVTFKQAAGFVLLGTVVWLLWILADQTDGRGVVWTVAFFGFLGLAAWLLGQTKPTWAAGSRAAMWLASLVVILFGLYFCYSVMYDWAGGKVAAAGMVS